MITMSDINKSIQEYINNVSKSFICNRKLKKTIINDFRNSVLDYKEENNITDIKKNIWTFRNTERNSSDLHVRPRHTNNKKTYKYKADYSCSVDLYSCVSCFFSDCTYNNQLLRRIRIFSITDYNRHWILHRRLFS